MLRLQEPQLVAQAVPGEADLLKLLSNLGERDLEPQHLGVLVEEFEPEGGVFRLGVLAVDPTNKQLRSLEL